MSFEHKRAVWHIYVHAEVPFIPIENLADLRVDVDETVCILEAYLMEVL